MKIQNAARNKYRAMQLRLNTLVPWIISATLTGCSPEPQQCKICVCGSLPLPADIDDAQGLFDLGHTSSLSRLMQSGDRVLSHDRFGNRWILWDTSTNLAVTNGQSRTNGFVGIGGDLVVIQMDTGLDLRSATTGELQGTVAGGPECFVKIGIADDGSYVWAKQASGGLKAWSAQGTVVLDVMGNYSNARLFAAPTEIRVAKGPAGVDRIENLPIGGGQPTLSPTFSHGFNSWMLDGERFFANVGNAAFIYSKQAELIASAVLPTIESLDGVGNRFWTFQSSTPGYALRIYNMNPEIELAATYELGSLTEIVPSKQGIGIIPHGAPEVQFIHTDTSATREVIPIPFSYLDKLAIDDTTGFWTVANWSGLIYHEGAGQDPQAQGTLGCGEVLDMAGTPSGKVAIALASKQVVILDMNAGGAVEQVLPLLAEKVQLTDDGSVLAAWGGFNRAYYLGTHSNFQVGLFSVASGDEIHTFTDVKDFSFSRNGQRIGLASYPTLTRQVMNIDGTSTYYSDSASVQSTPLLSPCGANFTVWDGTETPTMTTDLYRADPGGGPPTLVKTVPGRVTGWVDDNRFLAYTFKDDVSTYNFDKTIMYDAQGDVLANPPIPQCDGFEVASASTIYVPNARKMYDSDTGEVLWTNPLKNKNTITLSTVAGARVLVGYDDGVYAVPF